MVLSSVQKRKLHTLRPNDNLAPGVRVGTTHMSTQRGRTRGRTPRMTDPLGRTLAKALSRNPRGSLPVTHHDQPRASSPLNDNYCITMLQRGLLAWSQNFTGQTLDTCQSLNVNYHVVPVVHSAPGHSQKRE